MAARCPYRGGIEKLSSAGLALHRRPKRRHAALLVTLLLAASGCATSASSEESSSTTARAATKAAVAKPAPTTTIPTTTTTVPTTTTTAAPQRMVTEQAWTPYAAVGGITLHHPASRVERVGFHQSNHEGAQTQEILPTAVAPVTLESRERLTAERTAADIVVDPAVELRSPVSGVVKRAGTYVLYCKYSDDYLVIAPDARPEWEVKLLHISGVQVRAGDRVEAGVTVVAPHATQLPFESQVDEARTVDPAWPHVHVEVVDPSIPNRPSPGGGC